MSIRALHLGPDLTLPLDIATMSLLILGKKGSGKTNTLVVLAEELYAAHIPVCIWDPVGKHYGIKSSADGKYSGLRRGSARAVPPGRLAEASRELRMAHCDPALGLRHRPDRQGTHHKKGGQLMATATHELRIMDAREGDIKIEWDPDNADQLEIAKKAFGEAKRKGMLLYRVGERGRKGEQLTEFDPEAERIVASPRAVGG